MAMKIKYWVPYFISLGFLFYLGVKDSIDKHIFLSQGNLKMLLMPFILGTLSVFIAILWETWEENNGK
jgi:hypothetical protein